MIAQRKVDFLETGGRPEEVSGLDANALSQMDLMARGLLLV